VHGLMIPVVLVLVAGAAWAQTPPCDALSPDLQPLKKEIFSSLHPYDGCDETFDRCLEKKPPHPVVVRIANDLCRQIEAGKSKKEIERALEKRAQSMLPALKPAAIAVDPATLAGDPDAPVQAVVYACARCPFCHVIVPGLHKQVTTGALRGKVRLYVRPFPLKDHPGSTDGGLALIAAARLGKFWPLISLLYERFDKFDPKLLPAWAKDAGLDQAAFEREIADFKTRTALVSSKQEGIRNQVAATPTLFIDGRRYVYEADLESMVDGLLEAYESKAAAGNPGVK
jgi:protein-disulfide isomerase